VKKIAMPQDVDPHQLGDSMDRVNTVVDFDAYRQPSTEDARDEIIGVCQDIIREAKTGKYSGMLVVLRKDSRSHTVAMTGSYRKRAEEICIIAGGLFTKYSAKAGIKFK
jgi:hypothetical protein